MWLPCGFFTACTTGSLHRVKSREPGGRGRIRTFVARKERQIYSLLVLATHPPVPVLAIREFTKCNPRNPAGRKSCPKIVLLRHLWEESAKTQNGLVSKDTSPFNFNIQNRSAHSMPHQPWSWRRELNPRPSDYKSDALPAELRQPRSNRVRITDEARGLQGTPNKPSTNNATTVENPIVVSKSIDIPTSLVCYVYARAPGRNSPNG